MNPSHDTFPETTLAYVAGLFDGEGSIVIGCGKNKKGRVAPSYWLQVGITNTDRELIDWLHQTFGGHISDNSHSPSRRNQRACWAWRIMSTHALIFLRSIDPFLRVKKAQAELAIKFQVHMSERRYSPLPDSILQERESYRQELRNLTLGIHSL